MKYKKVIGLVVAIACALASIWVGAWLTGSVFSYRDWQHFPTAFTAFMVFFMSFGCALKIFVDGIFE